MQRSGSRLAALPFHSSAQPRPFQINSSVNAADLYAAYVRNGSVNDWKMQRVFSRQREPCEGDLFLESADPPRDRAIEAAELLRSFLLRLGRSSCGKRGV